MIATMVSSLVFLATCLALAHGASIGEVRVPSQTKSRSSTFAAAPLGTLSDVPGAANRVIEYEDPVGQIVGGGDAAPQQFPYIASMQTTTPSKYLLESHPQHICGGTLIALGWVLTAAHCIYGVPATSTRVDVVLGITSQTARTAGSQRITVTQMLARNSYWDESSVFEGFDIGLLKLAKKARLSESVKLAALPQADSIPTGDATAAGWGSMSTNKYIPKNPDILQTVTTSIIDFRTCKEFVGNYIGESENPIVDSNLCVGVLDRPGLSTCSGDSGGPLVQTDGDKATVIGIVSWGLGDCGSKPFPSVFTRVSAYTNWINTVLQKY